jgi:hypothetical protein
MTSKEIFIDSFFIVFLSTLEIYLIYLDTFIPFSLIFQSFSDMDEVQLKQIIQLSMWCY